MVSPRIFFELPLGGADVLLDGGQTERKGFGDLPVGAAFGVQEKTGLLLGGQDLQGRFQIELGEELLLDLVGEALANLQLRVAEGRIVLLDLLKIKVAEALAQRRIPCWDPGRLAAASPSKRTEARTPTVRASAPVPLGRARAYEPALLPGDVSCPGWLPVIHASAVQVRWPPCPYTGRKPRTPPRLSTRRGTGRSDVGCVETEEHRSDDAGQHWCRSCIPPSGQAISMRTVMGDTSVSASGGSSRMSRVSGLSCTMGVPRTRA